MRRVNISFRHRRLAQLALSGISLASAMGCAELPVSEMTGARMKLESARQSQGDIYATEATAVARRSYAKAREEMQIQGRRFIWFRNFEQTKKLARKAELAAIAARELAVSNKSGARDSAQQAIEDATAAYERTKALLDTRPLERAGHEKLGAVGVALAEAGDLLKKGEYLPIPGRMDRVIGELESMRAGIEVKIRSYVRNQRQWDQWVQETLTWSRLHSAHAIVVDKVNRRADLYYSGRLVKSYLADTGMNGLSRKVRRGDHATPEGKYRVVRMLQGHQSRFTRALLLDYPNQEDRRQFVRLKKMGSISKRAQIGGSIAIHGRGGRGKDWTEGCVALSDRDIEDLFRYVRVGTPVTIVGSSAVSRGGLARS